MMHDKQTAAIARYRAMTGLIKKMPPKAARRAKLDQKRYAARYVTNRRGGRPACDPLKMTRFLVDVCGLSLKEASVAVRRAIRTLPCGALPRRGSPETMAVELYRQTHDMVDAVALARFFGWASDEPQLWDAVRVSLSAMAVAPEATGIENWQEAAE